MKRWKISWIIGLFTFGSMLFCPLLNGQNPAKVGINLKFQPIDWMEQIEGKIVLELVDEKDLIWIGEYPNSKRNGQHSCRLSKNIDSFKFQLSYKSLTTKRDTSFVFKVKIDWSTKPYQINEQLTIAKRSGWTRSRSDEPILIDEGVNDSEEANPPKWIEVRFSGQEELPENFNNEEIYLGKNKDSAQMKKENGNYYVRIPANYGTLPAYIFIGGKKYGPMEIVWQESHKRRIPLDSEDRPRTHTGLWISATSIPVFGVTAKLLKDFGDEKYDEYETTIDPVLDNFNLDARAALKQKADDVLIYAKVASGLAVVGALGGVMIEAINSRRKRREKKPKKNRK